MRPTTELFLLIEFLDEFIYGAREAAWPLIRADFGLSYAQIGLLLSLPSFVSGVAEPLIGVLGDTWRRRLLILGGGTVFALALLLTALSRTYALLLLAFTVFSPASGAFVNLAQATLMDLAPNRRERNMARWTFAGSLGVVMGPIALGAAVALALGWRAVFGFTAVAALSVVVYAGWTRRPASGDPAPQASVASAPVSAVPHEMAVTVAPHPSSLIAGLQGAVRALRRPDVLRWLTLLQFSDLMLDILLGYLALYLVDVAGVTTARASTAVAIWTGVGLVGDLLIIRLLARYDGLRYLRLSAVSELVLFSAFLLLPGLPAKLVALGLLGLFNAGWYAILKAQLYAVLPGQSGTAMAVSNLFGLLGSLIPLALGAIAQRWGLSATMWCLTLGPIALLVGLPTSSSASMSDVVPD